MKIALACLIFLSASVSVFAEDFTTTDGKKFEGVTVTRIEADGIMVMTDSGIAKIFFARLPEEVQKKYGYDPTKAVRFQQQMQIDAAARRVRDEAAMRAEEALKRAPQAEIKTALNPSATNGLRGTSLDKPPEVRGTFLGYLMEKRDDGSLVVAMTNLRGKPYPKDEPTVFLVLIGYPRAAKLYNNDPVGCSAVWTRTTSEVFKGERPVAVWKFVAELNE